MTTNRLSTSQLSTRDPPFAPAPPSLRGKLLALFSDEKRFWWLCSYILGAFAILKGLRFPGRWALTQAELDYSHGLIKRGLLGAIYHALHAQSSRALDALFLVEFAAFILLLILFTRRAGIERRFGSVAPFALLISSYAITFLAHLIGFTEIVSAIIVIALLLVRNPQIRFLVGLPAVAIAVLIHENFLLLFLPLLLLSFLFDFVASAKPRRSSILLEGAALGCFAVTFTLVLFRRFSLSSSQIELIRSTVTARAGFPLDDNVFDTLGRSFAANVQLTAQQVSHIHWWAYFLISLFVLLPTAIPLLAWTIRLIHHSLGHSAPPSARLPPRAARWLVAAVVLTACSPLLLHIVGYDQVRWNALCTLNIYLTLLLTSISLPEDLLLLSIPSQRLIAFLIAINMASGWGLFDALNINPYPFFPVLFSRFK